MPKKIREQRRERFIALITADERLQKAEAITWAAEQLHVSEHTVRAWLKPETSKSSNEIPLMAIELLEYKIRDRKKGSR